MNETPFYYQNKTLHIEGISATWLAEKYGTPLYIYSHAIIENNFRAYQNALAGQHHLICYAVKANGNLSILNMLAKLGAGFDIVSQGELERVMTAGGDPKKVVFSGVGKTNAEIRHALRVGIHSFNIESEAELETLIQLTHETNLPANISIRVNPDIDPQTHPYIATGLQESKFGVDISKAKELYLRATKARNLNVSGVDCHIGSQITSLKPFIAAMERLLVLIRELREAGVEIKTLNMGGGLGIDYSAEKPPSIGEYMQILREYANAHDLNLIVEPGRSIVGEAGVLVTRVISTKYTAAKNFAVVDAAMNDLLRPVLYQAEHRVLPVEKKEANSFLYEIVGPICESSDLLAKERYMTLAENDLLAFMDVGAYGMSMASNYNARPRAAEVIVMSGDAKLIRKRESYADLMRGEMIFE